MTTEATSSRTRRATLATFTWLAWLAALLVLAALIFGAISLAGWLFSEVLLHLFPADYSRISFNP